MAPQRRSTFPALLLSALLATACAGTPGPGDAGYPFNVTGTYSGQFTVDGQPLSATLDLETRPGGEVVGEVRVAEMGITASLTGMLVANQLTMTITYRNPGNGCDGTAESIATVDDGGSSINGPLTVTECGQRLGGTLRFRR